MALRSNWIKDLLLQELQHTMLTCFNESVSQDESNIRCLLFTLKNSNLNHTPFISFKGTVHAQIKYTYFSSYL